MLDLTTPRGSIIAAALRLAAQHPWQKLTLSAIAEGAGVTLLSLKKEFASKGEILASFTAAVDDEVLRRAPRRAPDQPARDALFEVIMSRFDVLAPYKAALKSIAGGAGLEPAQLRPLLVSQQWMLEAAGIGTGGLEGGMKVAGLLTVYASVFRTWLEDDEAGLARTMAALDRRLRRGERALTRVEDFCVGLSRFVSAAMPRGFGRTSPSAKTDGTPAPTPPTTGGAQPGPAI
jgi:AcrR family transcriptional regulator